MIKFNLQELETKWYFRLLPLLISGLSIFNIPWTVVHQRFAKHGVMNHFFFILGIAITAIILFDWYVRNEDKISKKVKFYIYTSIILILSLAVRISFLDFESPDYKGALSIWYDNIKNNGGFLALKDKNLSDYNPSYLYIMAFLSYLPVNKLFAIKFVSIFFDYFAAFFAYKIVRNKYGNESMISLFAIVAVLFAPSVLLNGSFWSQCDVIYSSFLLVSIYFFSKITFDNSQKFAILGFTFFCISFIFKLQAVFFVLLIFYVYVQGYLRLTHLIILPIIWFLSLLPNYLLGRDLVSLILIYNNQIINYPFLTLNAANIYQLLPSAPYEIFVKSGIILSVSFCVIFSLFLMNFRKKIPFNIENLLDISLISLLIIPYLLPKMHERYFFAADLISIVWAFYRPKYWYLSLGIISLSTFSYLPFLFNQNVFPMPLLGLLMGIIILKTTILFVQKVKAQAPS